MHIVRTLTLLALSCGAVPDVPEPDAGELDAGRPCIHSVQHVCRPDGDGGTACAWVESVLCH